MFHFAQEMFPSCPTINRFSLFFQNEKFQTLSALIAVRMVSTMLLVHVTSLFPTGTPFAVHDKMRGKAFHSAQ